ncbi:MAG TPA: putative baseplate assembly protein, partial [Pyrinomonadaceae bacterium]
RGIEQKTANQDARDVVGNLTGIDYLEVLDTGEPPARRQRALRVHFIRDFNPPPADFSHENVRITGGERIRDVRVEPPVQFLAADVLEVVVNKPGDFSTYRLSIVEPNGEPFRLLDPLLSTVDFSFKVDCESKFDCRPECACPPEPPEEPEIDYLAKDYNSFRQLMFDRMAVVAPQWEGRNAADAGVALVELLAYVGDYLSYRQDAVATESYLGTARLRASVRRHARLVDYRMHDGSNARVWAQVRVASEGVKLDAGTRLLTRVPRLDDAALDEAAYEQALVSRPLIFETMHEATLFESLNELDFYAWGEDECCLPRGATRATLDRKLNHLKKGDVLVLKELVGPKTGEEEDADLRHRHAVRLTAVRFAVDPLFTDAADPDSPRPVTEIEWSAEDALPFPLCISSIRERDEAQLARVSVALGNIVLADHGRTIEEELPAVPGADLRLTPVAGAPCDRCGGQRPQTASPARYRPRLSRSPLTMAAGVVVAETGEGATKRLPFDPAASAAAAFRWEMRQVLPEVELDRAGEGWEPRFDLLSSDGFAPDFVAEVEEDGFATLRFGDDEYGLRPAPGDIFKATYRIGNGAAGNVGADALAHAVTTTAGVIGVTNPLPAQGGTEPESIEHVRRSSPFAFRTQERAVTPRDYAAVAERHPEVQRAAATMRWTGSWRTVFLTVDRAGGRPVTEEFELEMLRHLERYRMAGHDIEVDAPRFVSLELKLHVCVEPDYFRSNVERALLEVFGSGVRPDGRRGLFHPDNFTFGQPVHLSPLVAAAQQVEGVRFVRVLKFQRQGSDTGAHIAAGLLDIGRLEIARLDHDPNFPERGALRFELEGGR